MAVMKASIHLARQRHRRRWPPHRVAAREETMPVHDLPGGTYFVADLEFTRMGYGAMQLAGPGVFGPPKDHDAAIAVLRARAVSG